MIQPLKKNPKKPESSGRSEQIFIPMNEWIATIQLNDYTIKMIQNNPDCLEFGIDDSGKLCIMLVK